MYGRLKVPEWGLGTRPSILVGMHPVPRASVQFLPIDRHAFTIWIEAIY